MFVLTFLAPWDPLWWLIALFALTAAIYVRGLWRRRRVTDAPAALGFLLGLGAMYFVMLTRFDYYSEHMFFIHRLQHLVLHHVGPFLIALAAPSGVLAAGSPPLLRRVAGRVLNSLPVRSLYYTLQQPVIAGLLFTGLIGFWLLPSIHFNAMLNGREYWLMNLSMAADGLLFWWLMLDPRPPGSTPVTRSYGLRMAVLWAVMLPQIGIGSYIGLHRQIIYTSYAVCGRAWPVPPVVDQQLGGLITWIPSAMMSAIATLLLLRFYFRSERARGAAALTPTTASP